MGSLKSLLRAYEKIPMKVGCQPLYIQQMTRRKKTTKQNTWFNRTTEKTILPGLLHMSPWNITTTGGAYRHIILLTNPHKIPNLSFVAGSNYNRL